MMRLLEKHQAERTSQKKKKELEWNRKDLGGFASLSLKLPVFWKNHPDLRLRQVEANFNLAGITRDKT